MNNTATFIHRLIFDGGIINWFIIAQYVVMLLVTAERIVYYVHTAYNRSRFQQRILRKLHNKIPLDVFLSHCQVHRHSVPFLLMNEFSKYAGESPVVLNESIDRIADSIEKELHAHLDVLLVLSAIAPLCGLLGTVTGLMSAFDAIQVAGGTVEMGSLAGGIWSAMITTATGLLVAIPSFLIYKVFEYEQDKRMSDFSLMVSLLFQNYRPDCMA